VSEHAPNGVCKDLFWKASTAFWCFADRDAHIRPALPRAANALGTSRLCCSAPLLERSPPIGMPGCGRLRKRPAPRSGKSAEARFPQRVPSTRSGNVGLSL